MNKNAKEWWQPLVAYPFVKLNGVSRLALIGALFASLVLLAISTSPVLAQCPEDDPDCPLEPPQSEQIDADPINAEGSTGDADDPGALKPVEAEIDGPGPTFIDPVPLGSSGSSAPDFEKADIPMRWQDPSDVSCGVQALGMAIDGLGGGSPSSDAILEHLESNGMMYEFGTGVEELAFTAQNFGYKGTKPFHNWSLSDLQDELAEGRAPVVAIGANGEGQPGHFVTLTGVSPDGKWVSYNDPTLGEQTISTEEFERLWGLQGNSGVAVRKTVPAGEENLLPWVAIAATLMAIISQTPLAMRRMGIGGRLIAGAGTSSRKRIQTKKSSVSSPLGGVPSRAAKAISKVKKISRKKAKPITIGPTADPSPQMFNTAARSTIQIAKVTDEDDPPPTDPEDLNLWQRILVFFGADPAELEFERKDYLQQKEYEQAQVEGVYSDYYGYLEELEYQQHLEDLAEDEEYERQKQLEEEEREREFQRLIIEHTQPIEYVRKYVYQANGIDLQSLVENCQNNVLTMELIDDNSRYPGSVRSAMSMTIAAEENIVFLDRLGLQTDYWPNYEPAYLNALISHYHYQYKLVYDEIYSAEPDAFDEWIKKLFGRANSGTIY